MNVDFESLLRNLRNILPPERISTRQAERYLYSYDATALEFYPDIVVFPTNREEVVGIVKLAGKYGIPIVPRGAGSGMSGGALPVEGGIVLSFEKMNRIKEINTINHYAVVEPGVITSVLHREVEKVGLFYPPDPASRNFSSIGGNVAENAGGLRAVKYGVTRDYVMALEVVLPDGTVIHTGSKTIKDVAGYDLTRLLVGSEGTLGIITEITLKLIPLPRWKETFLAQFSTPEDAISLVPEILSIGLPSTLEFIDGFSLRAVESYLGVNFPGTEGVLLIENMGNRGEVEHWAGELKNFFEKRNVKFLRAENEEQREKFWKIRRSISASLSKIKPNRFNEDVVVKRSDLKRLIAESYRIAKKHNILVADFGHAGDGNIHVNYLHDRKDENERRRAWRATEEMVEEVIKMGGTVSGEHGIGIMKKELLRKQFTEEEIELMKKIKRAFDPDNILNPGKIF